LHRSNRLFQLTHCRVGICKSRLRTRKLRISPEGLLEAYGRFPRLTGA